MMTYSANVFSTNILSYAFGAMFLIVLVWAFFIVRRRMRGRPSNDE